MALTAGDGGGNKPYDSFSTLMNAGRKAPLKPWTRPEIPAAIKAPAYTPQKPIVNQAAPAYRQAAAAPAPAIRNTPSFGIGTPTSGGYGGTPAPAPQSEPVMSESDWLSGDGEYQNQLSQFDNSLTDFLSRLSTQKTDFTNDYNTAMTGFARNQEQGMQNLGEDFTSRGLANSGLFADQRKKTETMFQGQKDAMTTARDRANADFTNQESDKRKATDQAKGNAKLSSLGRMSMKQMF